MMKFSNVKEALDMLVIFNSKDSSPDYIVDENGNKTPITVEEVKSMNMEAIARLVELLGIDVHDDENNKKPDKGNLPGSDKIIYTLEKYISQIFD